MKDVGKFWICDNGLRVMKGSVAFELWSTHGMPLEITKDICREHKVAVDEEGFYRSMEVHRLRSKG
jgi:alanyl-tRNA synthetase